MVFSSYEFIFIFLPITVVGYFALRQWAPAASASLSWLIAASLVFYSVWDVRNLLVLAASIVVNFVCGSRLAERARQGLKTGPLLFAGVSFNLALLGWFKYSGFAAANVNALLGTNIPVLELVLPLAISFFTFQEIAYLVDSSRGETYGYRFKEYVLMVTFFPHLIAGPIVNHRILMRQFMAPVPIRISPQTFSLGLSFFVFGLAKKVLLADSLAPHANLMFDGVARGAEPGFAQSWVGTLAYTLQLYFDFSGYSDMAIGLALMFGVRLPLNFNSPYQAVSIADFWRRWHMTLSAFLRDYLYVALGGNRHGDLRRYTNLILTMLLGGLWHGAGWTFVCWGAFHGLGLAGCHLWQRIRTAMGIAPLSLALSRALTFIFVVFGWVLFRADSMSSAGAIIQSMLGLNGLDLNLNADRQLTAALMVTTIGALFLVTQFAPNSQQWLGYDPDRPAEETRWRGLLANKPLQGAALGCLMAFTLTQMSAVQSFLYFQF